MESYSDYRSYSLSLKNGTTTCESVVQAFLDTIKSHSKLNTFIEVYSDDALNQAKAIDKKLKSGEPVGQLAGLVVGVKDIICQENKKVSAGSNMLKDFTSLFSATCLKRLVDEDAIIIGRLNCDEFGMGSTNENSAFGPVLNGRDITKVSGGSSGGSAVAVQMGMCHLALGTDTGGSVRQPASFCGVVGYKPSYGKVSRHGLVAYASSFDQVGVLAKSLKDLNLLTEIMAGDDGFDATLVEQEATLEPKASHSKRLAYFKEAVDHPGLDAEIRETFLAKVEALKNEGWTIEAVDFPLLKYLVPTYYVLTTAEASSNLSRFDGVHYGHRSEKAKSIEEVYTLSRTEAFGREVKRRIMLGTFVLSSGYYDAYYRKAQQSRRKIKELTESILENCDAIISPTTPSTAFGLNEVLDQEPTRMYAADIFTVQANLVGAPAMSLPLFEHSNGMPFGMHVLGKSFREKSMVQIGEEIMAQGV